MLHVSEAEAKRHFTRMENHSKRVKEKAAADERKRKEKEENVLTFLHKHSGEFDKLKEEIEQPDKNQKREKFRNDDKFALILSNMTYDKARTTMHDLPAVKDDHKNMIQSTKMLQVPDENIYQAEEFKYDEIEEITSNLTHQIYSRTRPLGMQTGILGG